MIMMEQHSFTSDDDTDESNITSGFQFHQFSPLPSRTASPSLFADYLHYPTPENSPLVSPPTQLSYSLDWDVADDPFKPPSMHNAEATVATGSVVQHYDYNTKNNDLPPLLSTVNADAEDADFLQACFADDNIMTSNTGGEVLDLFSVGVDGVAANPPSSNNMADDPSSLVISVISFEHEQQVQQQFDQQVQSPMLTQQNSNTPQLQLDYLLKEDVPNFDPSQLPCCGCGISTSTSTSGVESNVYHDSQLRKADGAAATTTSTSMNKKSSSAPSDNTTSPQKASAADTSDATTASMNSEKRNTHSDRKRKSSSVDEQLARKNSARSKKKKRLCSADGCTNQVIRGGVCIRHGAKVEQCSSEGCTNQVVNRGVCVKHGAKKYTQRCSNEGCTNQARSGGLCIRHNVGKVKLCSSEGCVNQAKKGGVCIKHGAKVKVCTIEGCTSLAKIAGVCFRHGAKHKYTRCSSEGCTHYPQKGGLCVSHGGV